jgi:isocitrate lyase
MHPHTDQTVEDVLKIALDYELIIMHTSTPSLLNDVKCAEAIKAQKPDTQIGLIGRTRSSITRTDTS